MSATTAPTRGSTAPSPTAQQPRAQFPLGWLRGLAALCVVTFHAYQHNRTGPGYEWPFSGAGHQLMTGTDLFVDLFFVLSGIVLWLPIARSAVNGETGRSGRVLLYRRMARLLPLYLVVVLLVWAWSNPTFPGNWRDLVLHLTFTHVYSDQYIFWTDGPAWSLAVEFHFYLLMALAVPAVHAGVRRARSRRGRITVAAVLPVACLLATAAFYLWALVLDPQEQTNWSVWFSPLSRAADFGLGMGLALLSAAGVRLGRALRGVLGAVGVGATVALVMVRPLGEATSELWHPAYALTIVVGLASIVLHDGPWPRLLDWRPLAWIGGLCYGIYWIHEPVVWVLDSWRVLPEPRLGPWFLVTAVLVAVPTIALAWLSARTIEAAGLRVLRTLDRDGSPRDYYAHLAEPAEPAADQRSSSPV
ncbi:hypothetical protein BH11ACT8_BH11ACT8_19580 [soil metagenome]